MTINWVSLAIGSVLVATVGVVADWQIGSRLRKWSERRELTREYGSLAGHYLDYRVKDDGTRLPSVWRVARNRAHLGRLAFPISIHLSSMTVAFWLKAVHYRQV
jgi:hypothetical protein